MRHRAEQASEPGEHGTQQPTEAGALPVVHPIQPPVQSLKDRTSIRHDLFQNRYANLQVPNPWFKPVRHHSASPRPSPDSLQPVKAARHRVERTDLAKCPTGAFLQE
jgi:hypothetical protein